MTPTEADTLSRTLEIARAVLLGGAALLPLWPKVEFRGLERVQPPKPPRPPSLVLEHDWERQGCFWRCR
eukprot:3692143-Pyramimonas_sp.AAC.1